MFLMLKNKLFEEVVHKIKKFIYDLKETSRAWYKHLDKKLNDHET